MSTQRCTVNQFLHAGNLVGSPGAPPPTRHVQAHLATRHVERETEVDAFLLADWFLIDNVDDIDTVQSFDDAQLARELVASPGVGFNHERGHPAGRFPWRKSSPGRFVSAL